MSRPRYELADVIRAHWADLSSLGSVRPEQWKVLRDLARCRTAALGGHLDRCLDCGYERPSYNSCRNRHCPKCQALEQARWLDGRLRTLLPVSYFHVVFTVPGSLAPLALRNARRFYDLLFRASSQTLSTLGRDPRRLGARIGFTMVLHTWTQDVRFHPHVHAIVTGGGLAPEGDRWVSSHPRYLFPIRVLSRLFRGKMLALLRDAHRREAFAVPPSLAGPGLGRLFTELARTEWVTYAKRPFAGPDQVLRYLGHYTHRVGLSNHRLLHVTEESVTLRVRGGKSVVLEPMQLLKRFLLHVLPPGFVRIRHYGLLASASLGTHLVRARALLGVSEPPVDPRPSWQNLLQRLTGIDARRCPRCDSSEWIAIASGNGPRPPPRPEIAA